MIYAIAFLAPPAGWLLVWGALEYWGMEQEWKATIQTFDRLTFKHTYYVETGELWHTWAELPAITGEAHGRETSKETP